MKDLERKLMRWAALPLTSRRWAAPLSALALGFGLFVGVAISPNTAGTLATGAQMIELPSLLADEGGVVPVDAGLAAPATEPEAPSSLATAPFAGPASIEEAPETVAPDTPDQAREEPTGEPAEEEEEEPESAELAGTVVHVNPAAGSYTVVEAGGAMTAVHSSKLPQPGTGVEAPIEALANGTLSESGKRRSGKSARKATLTGVVSFVDSTPAAPAYTVSNLGVSVLVRVPPDPSGVLPTLPLLGSYATVDVRIEAAAAAAPPMPPAAEAADPPACAPDPELLANPPQPPTTVLWETAASAAGAPFPSSAVAGILTGVCPETSQVLISADDVRAAGRDLLLTVPPSVKLTELEVGESVIANAAFEEDGTLALTGIASDEQAKRADDAGLTQGDLRSKEKKK
ncbi:MAG TPA: hypothetical protein VIT85_00980 [Solirubrobacterales bacterium]